jgi:ELWxxDGT repeat protein
VNGILYFSARDSIHGNELWKSDGTESGTVMVKDTRPESYYGYNGGSYPANLTNVNGTLFFAATNDATGRELWRSDGTESGTVLVRDIRDSSLYYLTSSDPGNLIAVRDTLLFLADDGLHGRELWQSDGDALRRDDRCVSGQLCRGGQQWLVWASRHDL